MSDTTEGSAATLSADGRSARTETAIGPGEVLHGSRYELIEELGHGAYGVVFRAHDRVADVDVAIKLLGRARRPSTVDIERLRRELRAAWTVTHPGVVRIHDLIASGDQLALSMELVAGETLAQRVARTGKLALDELIALVDDLGAALAAVHGAGIMHRDVKPSNIMIRASTGRAVITDLGLSRMAGLAELAADASDGGIDPHDLTRTGELLGTPAYMAPEQLQRAERIGPAADIYALGLVLYEAATGTRAHPHAALPELIESRLSTPPRPVAELRPDLPARIARAIDRCLALDPERRIPDGVELARTLASRAPRVGMWIAAAAVVAIALLGHRTAAPSSPALPASDRQIEIEATGDAQLAPAVANLARRKLSTDRHVRVVDLPALANVAVALHWEHAGDAYEVTASIGPRGAAPIATQTRSAPSLAAALDALVPAIREVVDRDQPERPIDPRERAAMAAIGATDVSTYEALEAVSDEFFSTSIVDMERLQRETEAVIARDPTWAHPYVLLAMLQGGVSDVAVATRVHARATVDAARDPSGWTMLNDLTEQRFDDLDREFATAPDDIVTGWCLNEWARRLHRGMDAVAVLRSLFERRPDLQLGADLQAALSIVGHGDEAPAIQAAWLRIAPDNQQALTSQALAELHAGRDQPAIAITHELRELYGDSTQLLMLAIHVAIVSGDLPEATSAVTKMLRGTAYDRMLAQFELGQLEMLQGHFSAAHEAWRTATREASGYGVQGPTLQSLEELTAMDAVLGDTASLAGDSASIAHEYDALTDYEQSDAHRVIGAGLVPPKRCLDIHAMLAQHTTDVSRESYQRRVWRAAAEVGCVPCADVVRLGGSSEERSTRSLFRFADCAERVGQLELARDAYARARRITTLFDNAQVPATAYSILASFRLGRVLQRLGRTAEAKTAYAAFLERWGHSDRAIPEVEQARRALDSTAQPHRAP